MSKNAKMKKLGADTQKKVRGGRVAKKIAAPSRHADGVVADPKVKGKFRIVSAKEAKLNAKSAACWHMYGCPFCNSYSADRKDAVVE